MKAGQTILLIALCGGFAIAQTDDGNGLLDFDIQSTADLIRLEAEGFGDPVDSKYGNEDVGSDGVTLRGLDTAIIGLYSAIIFVGLIANSIVFFVIFAGQEIGKTVTTIYILMLTIADSVFLITLPIFSIQKLSNTWNFGSAMCAICQTIKFFNYYAGIFFLTAMSIDRYIAVSYSTRSIQLRTKQRTYIICGLVWAAAIVMSIPIMIYARIEDGHGVTFCRVMFPGYQFLDDKDATFFIDYYSGSDPGSEEASTFYDMPSGFELIIDDRSQSSFKCAFESQSKSYKIWLVANFLISFVIPFSVIVIMYAKILLHLRTAEQKIGHTSSNRAVRTRKRVTKMVAALVVCFTICWLPHHLLILARIPGFESKVGTCYGLEELFSALAFSNSAFNPILYTFLGNNFRERLRKSVRNTQLVVKRGSSRRGSKFRKSLNSHSGDDGSKKNAGAIYHKTSSGGSSKDSFTKGKQRKSQIALLGLRRDRSHFDGQYVDDTPSRAQSQYPSLLEDTMQTKLDT